MLYNYVSDRRNLNSSVVAFPASKTAGALTISSDDIYDFEGTAWGPAEIQLVAANAADITDSLAIAPFVSFDGGVTWKQAGDYTDLANGIGTISALKTLNYVPRIKIEAIFNATGALVAGHGCAVNVETREFEPNYARGFNPSVVTIPATKTAGAATYTGSIIALPSYTRQITVLTQVADLSKITNNFTYQLESSYDGIYWWNLWATAKSDIANGTGILYAELDMDSTAVVGTYARVVVTSDATGALASGHGINIDLLTFSR